MLPLSNTDDLVLNKIFVNSEKREKFCWKKKQRKRKGRGEELKFSKNIT